MASVPWLPSNLVVCVPTTSPSLCTGASAPSNKEECISTCQHMTSLYEAALLEPHDFSLD